jgi:hypothetical protein
MRRFRDNRDRQEYDENDDGHDIFARGVLQQARLGNATLEESPDEP